MRLGGVRSRDVLMGALVLWAAAFLYLTLTPGQLRIGSVDVDAYRSWGHVLGSMGLAGILYLLASEWRRWSRWRTALAVVLTVSAFGVAIELLQALTGDRDASVSDALLDVLGAVLAVAVLALLPLRSKAVTTSVVAITVVFALLTVVAAAFFTSERVGDRECSIADLAHRTPPTSPPATDGHRTTRGLVALYVPGSSPARTVPNLRDDDVSTDLHLAPTGVSTTEDGLHLTGGLARTRRSAAAISDDVLRSRSLTVEVWVRSADTRQSGPARIVTISDGTEKDDVNVHLGQERDALSVRLRASCGDFNWTMVDQAFAADQRWEHIALTFADGVQRIYVQGQLVDAARFDGHLAEWDRDFPLVVGNETTRDRAFLGDVAMVAVYDRALTRREVASSAAVGVPEP